MTIIVAILFLIASVPSFTGEACNNKYKNLVTLQTVLANDPYAQVPPFFSISSARIENFLRAKKPNFMQLYHDMLDDLSPSSAYAGQVKASGFFDWLRGIFVSTFPLHKQVLNAIAYSNFPFIPDEEVFLNDANQKNIFLMVRSSGLEDSKTTANAGLYVSVPYVSPNINSIREAVAQVVESYFNPQAIKNNLIAGLDLKNMPLCIPVLVQQLIGEPRGGTQDVTAIPVSGVAFTTQSGLSSEKFKVTEINASYGHGEGVVANKVSVDRYYVTESALSATGISIYPMITYKRQRLIPTQTGLQLATNPDLLITQPCISTEQIEKLYKVLKKIETAYGQPMDVEFVIQKGTIYIVQARPAMQFEQKPSYIPDTQLTDTQLNSIVPVNTLVAGSSQVCIVTDPDKLIIKDTLDDADADERRSAAQAVFVGAWASSLSHAAVNFIGFGVPCFYVQDINEIKTLVASMSLAQPLIIDTQRQMVYLWTNTNKTITQALQNGWYEHPIARSVSIIEGMSNYRIVRDVPVVPQDAMLIEKMHNLKNILGSDGQLKLYDEVMERISDRMKLNRKTYAKQSCIV